MNLTWFIVFLRKGDPENRIPLSIYSSAADYNQDGQVNILDLVQIANYIIEN